MVEDNQQAMAEDNQQAMVEDNQQAMVEDNQQAMVEDNQQAMVEDNQQAIISQFSEITGVSLIVARQCLENAGWSILVAAIEFDRYQDEKKARALYDDGVLGVPPKYSGLLVADDRSTVNSAVPSVEFGFHPTGQAADITADNIMKRDWSWVERIKTAVKPKRRNKGSKKVCESGANDGREEETSMVDPGRVVQTARLLNPEIWVMILELTTPRTVRQARLVCREIRNVIDGSDLVFRSCRLTYFGRQLPSPPRGMSELQYSILLDGDGCTACQKGKVRKPQWTWSVRWCLECYNAKTRTFQELKRAPELGMDPDTLESLLAAIPHGFQDSWRGPHFFVEPEEIEERHLKVQKVYRVSEVRRIFELHDSYELKAPDFDGSETFEENVQTCDKYNKDSRDRNQQREALLKELTEDTEALMAKAVVIEKVIREKSRAVQRAMVNVNVNIKVGRQDFFSRKIIKELSNISLKFATNSLAFTSATLLHRRAANRRDWKVLKTKIQKEWDVHQASIAEERAMEEEYAENVQNFGGAAVSNLTTLYGAWSFTSTPQPLSSPLGTCSPREHTPSASLHGL